MISTIIALELGLLLTTVVADFVATLIYITDARRLERKVDRLREELTNETA